eukprot:1596478-Rhodomonas_salina.2
MECRATMSCYAVSGTDIEYGATISCYAVSGYGMLLSAMRCPVLRWVWCYHIVLRVRYAVSGTHVGMALPGSARAATVGRGVGSA